MTIGDLLDIAGLPAEALTSLRLGYTESQGAPELRARIAGFYRGLTAEDILVTNAPEEAIFLTMTTLLDPGDRVVVQTPCYQSLSELAAARGCDVQRWPLVETETAWRMDLDRLADLLVPGTKMLVINLPHNPTGYLPDQDELDAILELVANRGVWLFSDEMYRGLEHEPAAQLSAAASRWERALSLWGMSKSFGLPGLRIGWLALRDRDLLHSLLRQKDYTTICNSAPSEVLARIALTQHEAILRRNLGVIRANLGHARAFAARHAGVLAWRDPGAGPVAFPRLAQGGAAAFCDAAVQRSGVLLVPSTLFDFGDSHIRLGLGRLDFPEGLAVLEEHLGGR
jgi:aspartate/methionine/tyrosine aminotransferase